MDLTYSEDCEKVIVKVPEELVKEVCLDQAGLVPRSGFVSSAVSSSWSSLWGSCDYWMRCS